MIQRITSWLGSLVPRPPSPLGNRQCESCERAASVLNYRLIRKGEGLERYYCTACARVRLWIPNPTKQRSVVEPSHETADVEVEVERILFTGEERQLVGLREVCGQRRLVFDTGICEATAIWWTLKGELTPRPLTHQAWVATVIALGATVKSVCVVSREEDTYFAEVRLLHQRDPVTINVRPSDGLLVAMRAGAPILFAEALLAADSVSQSEPA